MLKKFIFKSIGYIGIVVLFFFLIFINFNILRPKMYDMRDALFSF